MTFTRPPLRREFNRIIDEIRNCLDQKVEIAKDQNWLPRFEREFDLLGLCQRLIEVKDIPANFR